jgi:iron complex outermembrane receptor protein
VGNNYANQTFGELLYTSDADKLLSFILGANYFQEDQQQDFSVPISILPPPLDALGAVTVDLGAREIKSESYAAFGQATYRIGDALSVFAGLRYSHDAKSMVSYNNFGVSPATGSGSWSNISYEFGASYRFSPSITGYAKYSTGYKGGGFSAGAAAIPFDPETNSNIELGLKGSYFGGALQANLAAFNMTYDDLQVNQIVGPLVAVTNAAAATINGFEAEIRARPTEKLYVDLNAAYLDAKFDDFFTSDDARPTFQPDTRVINGVVTSGIELAGNRLPNAPEFTASAGLYYEVNLNAGTFTLGGRYDWKSRVYFSEFNLPVASQDAIGKLNLYARYVSEDGRWSAGIFALNVEDKQVISNVVVVSSLIGSLGITRYEPPRQVGVSIGFKY